MTLPLPTEPDETTAPIPQDNLSEREKEILRLVATGASNKEIAYKLVISSNTVKVHLRNIFAKIGVASRTEATIYAIRTGLLPPPAASIPIPRIREPEPEPDPAPDFRPVEQPVPLPGSTARRGAVFLMGAMLGILLLGIILALIFLRPGSPLAVASPVARATLAPPKRWSQLASLPAALDSPAGAVYENRLFVIGGQDSAGKPTAQVWRFDPASGRWEARAAKPTAVSRASAVLLGEKIYVPGGLQANGQPSSALEIYDPRLDRWETGAALPAARACYALAAVDGRLYLFGGSGPSAPAVDTVYAYDPAAGSWSLRSKLPRPRACPAAAVTGGSILLAGGSDGQAALADVDLYFPARDASGENPWEPRAPLPQPRSRFSMAPLADLVYAAGGEGSPSLPDLQYSPASNAWTTFDSPPHPSGPGALLLPLETHLHLLGGGLPLHQSYQAIYNVVFPIIQ